MTDLRMPHYHRIYLVLRERIADGTYPHGSLLPGEHELASHFGVSRITSRRAVEELVQAGLVDREQGRGTRVVGQVADAMLDGTLESLSASNRLIGRSHARIVDFGMVRPPVEAARALRLAEGERAFRIERIRSISGKPFCHVVAFLPGAIGTRIPAGALETNMLITLIERCGYRIGAARQAVSATIAAPAQAEALEIEIGAPLLRVIRTVFSTTRMPIEHVVMLFRSDRYQLELSLERGDAGGNEDAPGPDGAFRLIA